MKKYIVAIEETVVGEFEVIAENEKETLELARQKYRKSEFVLEPGELLHAQIAILKSNKEKIEWVSIY